MHLGNVRLVLCRRGRAEADGIAVIVQRKPPGMTVSRSMTHSASPGAGVEQNVVQLRVVVRHAQRQLSRVQQVHQHRAVRPAPLHKGNLLPAGPRAVLHVALQRLVKVCKTLAGIMEFLDGLVQRPGRIILQRAQKAAEALGRMVEVHRVRSTLSMHTESGM